MPHPRQPLVDAEFKMAILAAERVAYHLERMRTITEEDVSSADIPVQTVSDKGEVHKWVVSINLDRGKTTILQVGGN